MKYSSFFVFICDYAGDTRIHIIQVRRTSVIMHYELCIACLLSDSFLIKRIIIKNSGYMVSTLMIFVFPDLPFVRPPVMTSLSSGVRLKIDFAMFLAS